MRLLLFPLSFPRSSLSVGKTYLSADCCFFLAFLCIPVGGARAVRTRVARCACSQGDCAPEARVSRRADAAPDPPAVGTPALPTPAAEGIGNGHSRRPRPTSRPRQAPRRPGFRTPAARKRAAGPEWDTVPTRGPREGFLVFRHVFLWLLGVFFVVGGVLIFFFRVVNHRRSSVRSATSSVVKR